MLYWTPKTGPESDGWFYKTKDQWFEELRMTRTQQESARKILRDKGFIEEEVRSHRGTKLYFRTKVAAIQEAVEAAHSCRKPASAVAGNLQGYSQETCKSYKEAETTTETTSSPPSSEVSSSKKKTDPRYQEFIEVINAGYKKRGWAFGFSAADGKQMKELLKVRPGWTAKEFRRAMANYFGSDKIPPGGLPRSYLLKLPKYEGGKLDQFGKMKESQERIATVAEANRVYAQ